MSGGDPVKPGLGHVDRALTDAFLPTLPCWHSFGATPNVLTTLGLACSALCVYHLYHGRAALSIAFLALRCYFDYADGLLARKYDLMSDFGCYYDHTVDALFAAAFAAVVVARSKHRVLHLSLFVAFGAAMTVQMGCIEKDYHEEGKRETSISRLRDLCVKPDAMKWFDNGTFYLVLIFIIATAHRGRILPRGMLQRKKRE